MKFNEDTARGAERTVGSILCKFLVGKAKQEDLDLLKNIEQSIPTKYETSGLRRVCYFYNAHEFEQAIVDSAEMRLCVVQWARENLKKDVKVEDVEINFFDDSHNTFHPGHGTNNPDFKVKIDDIEITGEAKLRYSTNTKFEDTNLHDATLIFTSTVDPHISSDRFVDLRENDQGNLRYVVSALDCYREMLNPFDFPDTW